MPIGTAVHARTFALAETLKTVSTKIDDQTATNRKAFADQKLQIDSVADGVRVLREKADDTNVRLSTVSQELEAVRQAMSSMPAAQVPPLSEEMVNEILAGRDFRGWLRAARVARVLGLFSLYLFLDTYDIRADFNNRAVARKRELAQGRKARRPTPPARGG